MRPAAPDAVELRVAGRRKVPVHFGAPGRPLFGFYHPAGGGLWRDTSVVLVSPLGTEQTRSERTFRHLAERLAGGGFACLRFDLFGTGDSGGDESSPDLVRSWLEDVGLAIADLRARSGARRIAVVGLRLGATLACAAAAERDDVDSLVMWSPCVTGSAYVSEVTKLHKVYARIEPHLAQAPRPPADGEEALGSFLPRALIAQLTQLDLRQLRRRPARRTLVIDGGGLPERDALIDRLRATGAEPDVRSHPGHKFLVTVPHRALLPENVIDSVAKWLEDAHPVAPITGAAPELTRGPTPSDERALVFGGDRPLFGILTPAASGHAKAGRPPIVMTNAGSVNRSGPHRLYVKLARRWAALGFDVLRMDLSGVGDSPARDGVAENVTYPPSGVDDIGLAFRALGAEHAIVCGLCSGGDYAFQLGSRDPRVTGAWMLNPRTFCVLDLAAVESGAPPAGSVDEVPRSLRAMADRGVDTLVVVSRSDPGVAYVDVHAPAEMRALEGTRGYRRVDLDGTDHTFTPIGTQVAVSDLLTDHLTTRR
jgi:alpha-beta hydrolase superfamily lysophospholipase